jgi:hypothetical protein
VKYGNGMKQSVNVLVVPEEVPGLGADYVFDNCMDSEEYGKTF